MGRRIWPRPLGPYEVPVPYPFPVIPCAPVEPGETGGLPVVPAPKKPFRPVSPEEVEEFRELLRRARKYDKRNNEPDCEMEEKRERLRAIAKELGVEIDFV